MMKKALVTGATGFIGRHLCAELLSHNIDVTALCRNNDGNNLTSETINIIRCSMDEYDKLPDLLKGESFDIFYHLAWEGATGAGRSDTVLQTINAQRTLEALKAASMLGCKKFIAAGTVYENFYQQMAESSTFKNAAPYIMAKCFARDMSRQLALKLGIDLVWATFCHPVGKFMKQEQLLAYAVKSLLNDVSPEFGPAEDFFDIIAVEDLAHGLYLAGDCSLKKTACYIGNGSPRPLKDYLSDLPKILGVDTPVKIGVKPDDGMRFDPNWFINSEFIAETGFKAKMSFQEMVLKLKEYLE